MATCYERLLTSRMWARKYYKRNKRAAKRSMAAYRTKEKTHGFYVSSKEWFFAQRRLKQMLRPDLYEGYRLRGEFPLLDIKEVLCENADELQAYYKVKLGELRILYGRDPDTGLVAKNRKWIPESQWTPGYRRRRELKDLAEQREKEEKECPSPS